MATPPHPDSTPSMVPDGAGAAPAVEETAVSRRRAFRLVTLAYVIASGVAVLTALLVSSGHPIEVVLFADVAATCAVFAFSVAFANSSFYDAYWSVAPIAIAGFFVLAPTEAGEAPSTARALVAFALVTTWGIRLTWNWARGWTGLDHEDWRYIMLRERTGIFYWFVNFAGLHMLPTLVVFAGCLALYPALATGARPFGLLDVVAAIVTAGAIWLEGAADNQLRRFRLDGPPEGALLETGLWARSRHPNYLGEILFWWGLWLFGVAADPSAWWWTLSGPVSITVLFRAVSLPMIESRMLLRRPGYAHRAATTPLLIPRLRA